jgi:hypothetical protein
VIEGVIGTLEKGKGGHGGKSLVSGAALGYVLIRIQTVSQTVTNASTLLNTWTRMLSRIEHNQRVILDPNWNGAA